MSFHVFFPLILLLSSAWASAEKAPRMGEAEVREFRSGVPCFTISEREERRSGVPNFGGIAVYDVSSSPRAKMWAMTMPANRTFPVLFSMCVPYGGRVSSLPQSVAMALEAGKVYEVTIDARAGDAPDQPRSYGVRFCLAKQRDGSVAVRQIGARAHGGRHLYGCVVPK